MNVQELAQKLVQFESTHENKNAMKACLKFCVDFFDTNNVSVTPFSHEGIESVIVANTDAKHFDVLFLGHIDTVPGKPELFKGRVEDGKLYGRGSLDMKAFVATSLVAVKELIENNFAGTIALAIVTDEELGGIHGARHIVEDLGYSADTVLVPDDGENLNKVISETKRVFQIRFTARGKEAHANRPWDGVNAIELLMKTFQALRSEFPVPETEPDDRFIDTISLGTIRGGSASNEVPENAEMDVDVRIASNISKETLFEKVERSLAPGVSFKIVLEGPTTKLDTSLPQVKKYLETIEVVTGEKAELIKTGGATDARYFAKKGMVTIVHQGNGGCAQAGNEHVELDSLEKLVEIQKKFIAEYYG